MGRKAREEPVGLNVIVGVECPDCGDDYREKDITSWLYDEDDYLCGSTLHCRKCEHVWDYLYHGN